MNRIKSIKSNKHWTPVYKYKWNPEGLDKLDHVLNDDTSKTFKKVFYTSVSLKANVDTVATSFTKNGLSNYCSKHKSIVNSVKTKFVVYGKLVNFHLYFNCNALENITEYEYLGNFVKSVDLATSDIFAEIYICLCNKAC